MPSSVSGSAGWSALPLTDLGFGLVVGDVRAPDGLLEIGQRHGDGAGQLLERLGGDDLVRAPAGGGHPLA
jgi:hypothetical protein